MPLIKLLFLLAFRNLFTRRSKTLIVGAIMFSGTLLVVFGAALLDSLEEIGKKASELKRISVDIDPVNLL